MASVQSRPQYPLGLPPIKIAAWNRFVGHGVLPAAPSGRRIFFVKIRLDRIVPRWEGVLHSTPLLCRHCWRAFQSISIASINTIASAQNSSMKRQPTVSITPIGSSLDVDNRKIELSATPQASAASPTQNITKTRWRLCGGDLPGGYSSPRPLSNASIQWQPIAPKLGNFLACQPSEPGGTDLRCRMALAL